MIEAFKQLDGTLCLGEPLRIRRRGEETTQTNAQAAIIALSALQQITGAAAAAQRKRDLAKVQVNELGEVIDEGEEIAIGPETLDAKMSSLRSLIPSRIVKVNNIFNRDIEMAPEVYEELREDFEGEMHDIA